MTTLAELRKRLLEKDNREQQASNDNAVFPFWNIPENQATYVRFLPDADTSNPFFWVERQMIRLPFAGVVGQTAQKEVTVQVPCMEMWNETCPVLTEIRPWFKQTELEDIARKYWKKRSYIFQGFVRETTLDEKDTPENPIRRYVINPSIFKIIQDALMDVEMEEIPTDYHAGTDFKIVKTKQGGYSSYSTSNYARKSSPLTQEELNAIEQYGLFNLSDFLPKKPNDAGVQAIAEMFEASYNGEFYDPERWGNFFRPFGLNLDKSTSSTSSTTVASAPVAEQTTAKVAEVEPSEPEEDDTNTSLEVDTAPAKPAVVTETTEGKKSPQDIIAQIKARRAAAATQAEGQN